jgi:3-methyladenine DNA glycosylase AlkD
MSSPASAAARAGRDLKRRARPAGSFDASRYFRNAGDLGFLNVGMPAVRTMARQIALEHRGIWTVDDAQAFADRLVRDRYLEVKGLGVEVLARYRKSFAPRHLATWKRWLAANHCANWATTDAISGLLIGPLLADHPELLPQLRSWSRHPNLWVRRASVVGLLPPFRRGLALDLGYENAARLHRDPEDLIQKAVGWMLREAGKVDEARLERYLRANGPRIPRTTLRYAIERFSAARRRELLEGTRAKAKGQRWKARAD